MNVQPNCKFCEFSFTTYRDYICYFCDLITFLVCQTELQSGSSQPATLLLAINYLTLPKQYKQRWWDELMVPSTVHWVCPSLNVSNIFTLPPKWELSPGAGEQEMGLRLFVLLCHNPINNESASTSRWSLTLLLGESFSMFKVHLWPGCVSYFPSWSRVVLQSLCSGTVGQLLCASSGLKY